MSVRSTAAAFAVVILFMAAGNSVDRGGGVIVAANQGSDRPITSGRDVAPTVLVARVEESKAEEVTDRATILISGVTPSGTADQVLPGEIERGRLQGHLRRYHALILDYRRSGNDTAVKGILSWDRRHIQGVLAAIDKESDELRPWDDVRFKAAALMHTDAALQEMGHADPDLSVAFLHFDAASQVFRKAGPGVYSYTRRWYQTVARLLRSRNSLLAAERFLAMGRERLPRDPTILYESGTLQELLATDTVLPTVVALPDLRTSSSGVATRDAGATVPFSREDAEDSRRRRAGRLDKAASWLRDSLEADSSQMLARLHLGRVQTLRNQPAEALRWLQQAAGSEDLSTGYLATLFTGALYERQNRLDEAAQAYRAAIERSKPSHAAYFALSAVLQRSGRGDESRDVLKTVLDATPGNRRDPWWSYLMEPSSVNVGLLNVLRREARD